MTRLLIYVALAGIVGSTITGGLGYWRGYVKGGEVERVKQEEARQETQQELFELGDEVSRQAAEIERLRRERASRVINLEAEAYRAPGASNPGIGPDGLQRLEQRWSAP